MHQNRPNFSQKTSTSCCCPAGTLFGGNLGFFLGFIFLEGLGAGPYKRGKGRGRIKRGRVRGGVRRNPRPRGRPGPGTPQWPGGRPAPSWGHKGGSGRHKMAPNSSQKYPKIHPKTARNVPKFTPKHPKIHPKTSSKLSQNSPQNGPKLAQN